MPQETRPMKPEDGFPISHTNVASVVTPLADSPGANQSWFITGFIMSGGSSADGFSFLRRAALALSDDDETVTISDADELEPAGGDFTIVFGIKTGDVTLANIISKWEAADKGYNIEVLSTGQLKITFGDGTTTKDITSRNKINDGRWHYVIVNWKYQTTTGLSLYIDNEEAADAVNNESVGSVTGGNGNLVIKGTDGKTVNISVLGLYKAQILSEAERTALWANGAGSKFTGNETGLSGAWNLDESSGHTLTHLDMKGVNDGTSSSTILWLNGEGFPIDPHTLEESIFYTVGVINTDGVIPTTVVNLPHAIKIGRNNPIRINEIGTSGWGLELYGYPGIH